MKTIVNLAAAVIAFMFMGAGLAHSYSFGVTTVSYDGKTRGDGYGKLYPSGWDGLKVEPWLKDRRSDSDRPYIEGAAYDGPRMGVKIQSDRRRDGGTAFADMANKVAHAGTRIAPAYTTVKVCMDRRPFKRDTCKTSKTARW